MGLSPSTASKPLASSSSRFDVSEDVIQDVFLQIFRTSDLDALHSDLVHLLGDVVKLLHLLVTYQHSLLSGLFS